LADGKTELTPNTEIPVGGKDKKTIFCNEESSD
jgi:hypothetical protein